MRTMIALSEPRNQYTNASMELYAYVYQLSDGNPDNLPESLRGFYDWELGKKFIDELRMK